MEARTRRNKDWNASAIRDALGLDEEQYMRCARIEKDTLIVVGITQETLMEALVRADHSRWNLIDALTRAKQTAREKALELLVEADETVIALKAQLEGK